MTTGLLQQIYVYAERENLFLLKPINQLDKTCCLAEAVEVVDFDYVKDQLTERMQYGEKPKSCDGAKFFFDQNRLVFIEMKGFRKMETFFLSKKLREEHEQLIEDQVTDFDISKKVEDTLKCWQDLLILGGFQGGGGILIEFVLLTDVDILTEVNSEDYIDFMIQYYADEKVPLDVIAQVKMQEMLDHGYPVSIEGKPLLLSCSQITEYLSV